jgi:hypothetical protein
MNIRFAVLTTIPLLCIGVLAAHVTLPGAAQAAGQYEVRSGEPFYGEGFGCTNETLRGRYGFAVTGSRPAMPGGPPVAVVGTALTTFHGDGTFDQFDNINVDSPAVPFQPNRPGTGTYTLNPDCSGSMSLTAGGATLELRITVVDRGQEVRTAVVTPNVIVSSNGRKM